MRSCIMVVVIVERLPGKVSEVRVCGRIRVVV
jgi:hypothetical protein